jgi:hypothetical protein
MPHFYFHVLDGTALPDRDGVDLRGIEAARTEAMDLAGALLRDGVSEQIWQGHPWQLVVSDSTSPFTGRTHFVVSVSIAQSPDLERESAITAGYERLARILDAVPTPEQK